MKKSAIKLYRNKKGDVKNILSVPEGISYQENPLDFFIMLARYKFAARLLKKKYSVIDAGCGQGLGAVFLSKFAGHVTGVDCDEEMINDNKKRYKSLSNLDFLTLDLLDISSHKKKYDVVVSLDVIEHFSKKDTERVAGNYAKLTKERGFAVIGTPNIFSQPFASKRRRKIHLHEFNPGELETLLSKYFKHVFVFSMTDEIVSLTFPKMAWYLMAICIK